MDDGHKLVNKCKVCGEQQFTLREGFYYCQECGTKEDKLRAIEVDREEDFLATKHVRKQKIRAIKTEKPNLTSWECYNYILRGLVNDLLSLGAKEELKLVTLQLWAAYLRRNEVAFFNRKRVELPKLGLRYLPRDASALYNHALQRRAQKRKRRRTDGSGASLISSEAASAREFRRCRRKFDESSYSLNSSFNSTGVSQTSLSSTNTSSTGTTSHAIKLEFSARARKHLKKSIPVKHIDKHALDFEGNLKCHNMRPLARSIKRTEHAVLTMNVRQIYSILGIALNLIGDEIQLCDLVRFIDEEHVSTKDVIEYFPENIAKHGKQLLHEIQFYKYPTKYTDKLLREHIFLFSKFINLREFKQPEMIKLTERYVTELNLPPDVFTYIEHLINLLPPKMRTRISHVYPAYEARAMAYIIFVLKLLFGLDGHTENRISDAATKVNHCLRKLSEEGCSSNTSLSQPPFLFVWKDWVDYVEMRKVIVSHYNANFCLQFKQRQSTSQILKEMEEEQRTQLEQAAHMAEGSMMGNNSNVTTMHRIFEKFVAEYNDTLPEERVDSIIFPPSLTPAHSYFKRILMHCSNAGTRASFKIPEFMRTDHMQRTSAPYVHAKELKEYFKQHNWELKVRRMPSVSRRDNVGIFRPINTNLERSEGNACTKKVDFNISEEEWLQSIVEEELIEEIQFKTEYDMYEKNYRKKLRADALKRQQAAEDIEADKYTSKDDYIFDTDDESSMSPPPAKTVAVNEDIDVRSMHSINAFSERDMEPITRSDLPVILKPHRRLHKVHLFAGLSDDEADEVTAKEEDYNTTKTEEGTCTLLTTNMDCWTLLGYPHNLSNCQKKILEGKFPRSFFWLLETCAQSINIDWCIIYEELLTIELMFAYGIEDLNDFKDCVRFKYNNPIKDFNMLINSYRELW